MDAAQKEQLKEFRTFMERVELLDTPERKEFEKALMELDEKLKPHQDAIHDVNQLGAGKSRTSEAS